ncbi:MAG TPA: outer membrane lipoprotein chaperone LolA [Candidatus Eisenbacteria bacterium]|nr:outer membrane lipoprotein chaperone LolA [Candidatus Eisenbacteria bacterium]
MHRLAACVLGAVLVASTSGAASVKEALDKLQARYDTTKTMEADFQQTVESPTLAAPLKTSGKVAFEKPNRMRWDYDPPDKQTIVGDGATLWLYQPDMNQVIKTPLGEAFQAATPLTFLSGLGRLERDFTVTLESETKDAWVLKLVPKKDAALGTLRLTVRKDDASIAEARITDSVGTTTRIAFSNEKRNGTIEAARFTFTPPAGVDVVKPPAY